MKIDNGERDKFLTEQITFICPKDCGCTRCCLGESIYEPFDFSTWDNFGKLLEWVKAQDWYCKFVFDQLWSGYAAYRSSKMNIPDKFINPDEFAKAVYDYLKSKA